VIRVKYTTAVVGMTVAMFFGAIGFFLTITVVGAIVGIPMMIGAFALGAASIGPYMQQQQNKGSKPEAPKDDWYKHL
jgi:hypothetical protein